MLDLLRQPADVRADVIRATALKTGLAEAIVEKDLWVCYTLDYLFNRSEFGDSIVFKGGTSLSKAFGLIERFSEDIDLILDWRALGYGLSEPWEERSNAAQERFKQQTIIKTNDYLANVFSPSLKQGISEELGLEANINAGDDEETVIFAYPKLFTASATLDVIKLEIGPLAAWSPSEIANIKPYAAEQFPQLFMTPATSVKTAVPERTFWEKATILHQEANRPEGKAMPRRYARHYYDMYKLGNSEVAARAIAQPELLAKVVAFKEKFYRTPWAKLTEAVLGTIKLVPRAERIAELRTDYESMRPMIFGEVPEFEDIVAFMGELERKINGEV